MSEKYYDKASKNPESRIGGQDSDNKAGESFWDIFRQKHETELNIAYKKDEKDKDSSDHH